MGRRQSHARTARSVFRSMGFPMGVDVVGFAVAGVRALAAILLLDRLASEGRVSHG
jgi:hypothetical protein